MPIIEAMSHGTPTISYDIDFGPRFIIGGDSKCGVLVPNGDIDALSEAIRVVLLGDRDDEIRHRSFERAKRFSADAITEEWIELINGLVSKNSAIR